MEEVCVFVRSQVDGFVCWFDSFDERGGAVCKRGRLRELLSLFLHSVLGYY